MLYKPLFEVFEIPNRETFILALLRNIVVEINTSYPEYVELVEALADEHIVLIADRLQLLGERPFGWGVALTVYGQQQAFRLWADKSGRYPGLTADERMTMLALETCNAFVAADGRVYIDTFEDRYRDIWLDVSPDALDSLAEKGLIQLESDGPNWIVRREATL